MKLLFDQNVSFRILDYLESRFQDSTQVRNAGLEGKTDLEIWVYAKQNGYSIVTFDADFSEIASLRGIPPKVIWLRTGNRTTREIANLLNSKVTVIRDFLILEEFAEFECMEIEK